jgi:hypothetical protein
MAENQWILWASLGGFGAVSALVLWSDAKRKARRESQTVLVLDAPKRIAVRTFDTPSMRVLDARDVPAGAVWDQTVFRVVADQERALDPMAVRVWCFSREVIDELTRVAPVARIIIAGHLGDGRKLAGKDYLFVADEATGLKLADAFEIVRDANIVVADSRTISLAEVLAFGRAGHN